MIHITCISSANNKYSSGHNFWEIFTVYIFAQFINIIPVWHNTWNLSLMITQESFKHHTTASLSKYDHTIYINKYKDFGSLTFDKFTEIINIIQEAEKKYKNTLVILTNVCCIHPDVLCLWYKLKYIQSDVYTLSVKPALQKLYFYDHETSIIDSFSIHIRRGDLAQWCYDIGFTIDYYKNIINIINEHFNIKINIYCEHGRTNRGGEWDKQVINFDYNDIMVLETLKNVTIIKGLPTGQDFHHHFNELCRSKIVMMSPSSFSLFAGFITNGLVLVDEKCFVRDNLYRNSKYIPNFIVFKNFEGIIEDLKKIIN